MIPSYNEWSNYRNDENSCFHLLPRSLYHWINVDIKLDNCQSYQKRGHPLWIYFRNSYNESEEEWIPLTVDRKPIIPFPDLKLKISQNHFKEVSDFVSYYSDLLRELADIDMNFNGFIRSADDLSKILESQKCYTESDVEELSITSSIIDKFQTTPESISYVIFIRRAERDLPPHIHIGDDETYPLCTHFHAIVSLLAPQYLFFTGECKDTLDERQLNGFIKSLSSSDEDGNSNWRFALKSWNSNNHSVKISIDYPMPDYLELLKFDAQGKKNIIISNRRS